MKLWNASISLPKKLHLLVFFKVEEKISKKYQLSNEIPKEQKMHLLHGRRNEIKEGS